MIHLPIEIQELIIDYIPEPKQRFKIATSLRLLNIQKKYYLHYSMHPLIMQVKKVKSIYLINGKPAV